MALDLKPGHARAFAKVREAMLKRIRVGKKSATVSQDRRVYRCTLTGHHHHQAGGRLRWGLK